MHISLRDSAAAGFKRWSAAHPNASTNRVPEPGPAAEASADVETIAATADQPRAPWLIPGPGTL